jgi:hypothetical protein
MKTLVHFLKPEPKRVLLYLVFLFLLLTLWFYILWQDATANYLFAVDTLTTQLNLERNQSFNITTTQSMQTIQNELSNAEQRIVLRILPLDQTSVSMNLILPRYALFCFSVYDIYGCPISGSIVVNFIIGQLVLYLAACAVVSLSEILKKKSKLRFS